MRVKDLMSTPAQTCYVDTDLGTVGGMMQEHDLGFIPVVSAARKVVGLVTDRDICMLAASRRLAPVHLSAAQAMSDTVHTCFPDDAVDFALASMRQFKVSACRSSILWRDQGRDFAQRYRRAAGARRMCRSTT